MHADGEGDIWVGTQDNGLIILDRNTLTTKKWFSTEFLKKEENIPDNTIWCILEEEEGKFWVGTRDAGLLLMDKDRGVVNAFAKTSVNQNQQDENSVRSILTINDSTLALGFENMHGVQLFNKYTGEFKPVIHPKSVKTNQTGGGIKSLYYQNGWLWMGTAGNGLVITHLESGSTIYLDEDEITVAIIKVGNKDE
jgi:ligand-binding sensor domain-containing protein